VFLLLRLRSIKFDLFRKRGGEEDGDGKVIALLARGAKGDTEGAGKAAESGGTPLERGLTQIKLDDGSFESESFVGGTKVAFEMVVEAFAKGDTKNLRPLLSNDVYEDFSGAIKSRADNNETLENSLVGISEAEIIEAELQDKTAFITVKFVSEQINVTRNAEGEVVDGDPGEVTTATDVWTFARNTRSRDPNWTVVATGTSI
jgi:predicted lipid-binding transport protein (Tim44 family)